MRPSATLKRGLAFPPTTSPLPRSMFELLKPRRKRRSWNVRDPHKAVHEDDLFYLALAHRYW